MQYCPSSAEWAVPSLRCGHRMNRHRVLKPTFGLEHQTSVALKSTRSDPHARYVIRVQSQLDEKRFISGFNGLDRPVQIFV